MHFSLSLRITPEWAFSVGKIQKSHVKASARRSTILVYISQSVSFI